jgi:hypothetical protein
MIRRVVSDEIRNDRIVTLVGVHGVPHPTRRYLHRHGRLAAGWINHQQQATEVRAPGHAIDESAKPHEHGERRKRRRMQVKHHMPAGPEEVVKVVAAWIRCVKLRLRPTLGINHDGVKLLPRLPASARQHPGACLTVGLGVGLVRSRLRRHADRAAASWRGSRGRVRRGDLLRQTHRARRLSLPP